MRSLRFMPILDPLTGQMVTIDTETGAVSRP